jgi:YD repeat-containing protein
VTENTYDAVGNLLTVTDPLDNVTTFAYDALYRLTTLTEADPDGGGSLTSPVTTYAYDAVGNRTSLTDPLDRTTEFEYDDLNRLISITDCCAALQNRHRRSASKPTGWMGVVKFTFGHNLRFALYQVCG